MRLELLLCLVSAVALEGQLSPTSEQLLQRIRDKMAEHLARLPDYTCRLTIERTVRPPASRRFRPYDTLRMEVAYVGGKELYSWPGAGRFEDKRIDQVVEGGATSSGGFALHAWVIFRTSDPTFTRVETELRDRRATLRCDFEVPRRRSHFMIRSGKQSAMAGYHGSFWVDAETLEPLRLEVTTDDIPPQLEVAKSANIITYGPARLGDGNFVLPLSSELVMHETSGAVIRNQTRLDACRQYLGESAISFGETVPAPAEARALTAVRLPPDLALEVTLASPLDVSRAAIGDPVTATVNANVRSDGAVLVRKGAALRGRIARLDVQSSRAGAVAAVGFLFHTLEFGNARAEFTGVLEEAWSALPASGSGRLQVLAASSPELRPRPGEGVILLRASSLRPVPGLRMRWRTLAPQP
ncbi:MAG: hypothetical protein FJW34_19585 [Acidobacteria bacterium]|nr:hypothetical protein [Acidobacteriota bacterium]